MTRTAQVCPTQREMAHPPISASVWSPASGPVPPEQSWDEVQSPPVCASRKQPSVSVAISPYPSGRYWIHRKDSHEQTRRY